MCLPKPLQRTFSLQEKPLAQQSLIFFLLIFWDTFGLLVSGSGNTKMWLKFLTKNLRHMLL